MPCDAFRGRYYNHQGNTVQGDSFSVTVSRQNLALLGLTAPWQKHYLIPVSRLLNTSPVVCCSGFHNPLQARLVGMNAAC